MTRREQHDVGGMDQEKLAQLLTDRLFECEQCEKPHEETEAALDYGWTGDGRMALKAEFECPECGWQNRNTAFLGE